MRRQENRQGFNEYRREPDGAALYPGPVSHIARTTFNSRKILGNLSGGPLAGHVHSFWHSQWTRLPQPPPVDSAHAWNRSKCWPIISPMWRPAAIKRTASSTASIRGRADGARRADWATTTLPVIESHWTDHAGRLSVTGNPLDFAIDGEGLFGIRRRAAFATRATAVSGWAERDSNSQRRQPGARPGRRTDRADKPDLDR